ncbi:MAG: dihydrolipoyl dehydrogenase [Alphaproteobacteria bacterium]
MSDEQFDVVIIGAGPGGYVAAIRAAQLGLKVACVEKRDTLGGTCLNVGCIPSKALLHATELLETAQHQFASFGIKTGKVSVDLPQMMQHKSDTVTGLTDGIGFLFKKNKVTSVFGTAKIDAPGQVSVTLNDGGAQVLKAKNIVIATGSEPASIPGVEIDEERIVSSTGALELSSIPKKMVMIGAGVIGLEMGSVWARLGTEVTVVEFLDRITPGMDGEISKQFQRTLKKQGMTFHLSTKVTGVEKLKTKLKVDVEPVAGGDGQSLDADVVLVAVGRRPFTDGLGLDTVGVTVDERGMIPTDAHFKTNIDGIYAIGDVITGPMLAHKAEDEGVAIAEHLAGKWSHVNYDAIPSVVYTHPEVASVGMTEELLKEAGIAYNKGKFPFTANARAKSHLDTEGFVKILASKETDRVLGVHMIGPGVGELIGEAVVAMELGASAEDIARTCHAHPTMSEAVKEAALGVDGRIIHA